MKQRGMDVEVLIHVDEVFDVVRGKMNMHAGEVGINSLVRRVEEIEDLVGKEVVRILEIRWHPPFQVGRTFTGTLVCRP